MYRPGLKKIIIGAILFFISFLIPIALVVSITSNMDKSKLFKAPGSIEISIKKVGKYYLWYNHVDVFEGQSYNNDEELPEGLSFFCIEKKTKKKLVIQPDSRQTQSGNGTKSRTVGFYEISTPETYIFYVSGNMNERLFSVGQSIFDSGFILKFFIWFLLSAAFVISAFIFFVLGIIDFVKNSDKKNKINAAIS